MSGENSVVMYGAPPVDTAPHDPFHPLSPIYDPMRPGIKPIHPPIAPFPYTTTSGGPEPAHILLVRAKARAEELRRELAILDRMIAAAEEQGT